MAKTSLTAPTSDLAVWVDGFTTVPAVHRAVVEMMAGDENPGAAIAMGLLTGTSIDDVFGTTSVVRWQEGETYNVLDASLQRSDYTDNPDSLLPVYAVIKAARDEDGSEVTLTHGGANVVSQLIAAKANGWFPLRLKMVGATTGRNTIVYRLVTADPVHVEEPFGS